MNEWGFRLLSETSRTLDYVDDPEFTEVTGSGEIYTLFRIVRITHEAEHSDSEWTHLANVVRVSDSALGVAELRVVYRVILDARVTVSGHG